jgi:hypothetical protein
MVVNSLKNCFLFGVNVIIFQSRLVHNSTIGRFVLHRGLDLMGSVSILLAQHLILVVGYVSVGITQD